MRFTSFHPKKAGRAETRKILVLMLAVAAAAIMIALYIPLTGQNSPSTSASSVSSVCHAPPEYVTVIADHAGFNGSVAHGAPKSPWPVVTVHQGATVRIFVCNLDRVEPHGFAIDHYLDGGVTLRPGDTYEFSFVANQPGKFTIFCNVFCTVHVYMQGQLVVIA